MSTYLVVLKENYKGHFYGFLVHTWEPDIVGAQKQKHTHERKGEIQKDRIKPLETRLLPHLWGLSTPPGSMFQTCIMQQIFV